MNFFLISTKGRHKRDIIPLTVNMGQNQIKIIVYSDYICPFCHIGFHRLEQLKQHFPLDVEVRPFELHPETPQDGLSYDELPFDPVYLAMAIDGVKRLAAEDNIKFNLPSRMPNSMLALFIAEFAKKRGCLMRTTPSCLKNIG